MATPTGHNEPGRPPANRARPRINAPQSAGVPLIRPRPVSIGDVPRPSGEVPAHTQVPRRESAPSNTPVGRSPKAVPRPHAPSTPQERPYRDRDPRQEQSPQRPRPRRSVSTPPRKTQDPHQQAEDDRWVVDKKTGVRYKAMHQTTVAELKDMKRALRNGIHGVSDADILPREEEFESIDAFSGSGMDKAAKTLLAHLQVPPSQEEIERMRKEYAARQKKAAEEYKNIQGQITKTRGDDETTYF